MPRSAEQLEVVRAQSQDRLEQAALRVFARSGYAGASVRDVAREAGVSLGLLYNYFDGKQGLLIAIFRRSMADVARSFAEAEGDGTPEERLARLIRSAFRIVGEHRDFWMLLYGLRHQPEVIADLSDDLAEWTAKIHATLASHLRALGHSRHRAEGLARIAFATIDGVSQHYLIDPKSYPVESVSRQLVELLTVRSLRTTS